MSETGGYTPKDAEKDKKFWEGKNLIPPETPINKT